MLLKSYEQICQPRKPIKLLAKEKLHGTCIKNRQCTIMLLLNLAEPDWISVNCNLKLLHNIICIRKNITEDERFKNINFQQIQEKYFCNQYYFKLGDKCFALVFQSKSNIRKDHCQLFGGIPTSLKQLKQFYFIFNGIMPLHKIPHIIYHNNSIFT